MFPPPSRRVARLPALVPLHPLLLLSGDVGGGVGLGALKQREDQGGVRLVGGGVANDGVVLEGKDISGYGKVHVVNKSTLSPCQKTLQTKRSTCLESRKKESSTRHGTTVEDFSQRFGDLLPNF